MNQITASGGSLIDLHLLGALHCVGEGLKPCSSARFLDRCMCGRQSQPRFEPSKRQDVPPLRNTSTCFFCETERPKSLESEGQRRACATNQIQRTSATGAILWLSNSGHTFSTPGLFTFWAMFAITFRLGSKSYGTNIGPALSLIPPLGAPGFPKSGVKHHETPPKIAENETNPVPVSSIAVGWHTHTSIFVIGSMSIHHIRNTGLVWQCTPASR